MGEPVFSRGASAATRRAVDRAMSEHPKRRVANPPQVTNLPHKAPDLRHMETMVSSKRVDEA
jgi:hypothetical protein